MGMEDEGDKVEWIAPIGANKIVKQIWNIQY